MIPGRLKSRRSSLTNFEIIEMPETNELAYHFPWNMDIYGYDTSSFDPTLSDGRLTSEDIKAVTDGLRGCPNYPKFYPRMLWCNLIPLFGILACIVLIAVFSAKDKMIMVWLMIPMLVFLVTACIINFLAGRQTQVYLKARNEQFDKLLKSLQKTIFTKKQAVVRLSPYQGYLSVELQWKSSKLVVVPQKPEEQERVGKPTEPEKPKEDKKERKKKKRTGSEKDTQSNQLDQRVETEILPKDSERKGLKYRDDK